MNTARPGRLPEIIADRIQSEILSEGYTVGRQLPTEPQLSERHDVSRTVIREAARILEQRGLVSIRPGRGMVVAQLDATPIARHYALLLETTPQTLVHLMEIRQLVEVHVAGAAAVHRSAADIAELRACMASIRAVGDDFERSVEEDLRFHTLLGRASGNPLMVLLMDPINECLRQTYRTPGEYLSRLDETVAEHDAILSAVERGDSAAAESATRAHLDRVRASMEAYT